MIMLKDVLVRAKTKLLTHINGFYFPCPTHEQLTVTTNLIDSGDRNPVPRFSVYVVSPGTSANQPYGFAGLIESEGVYCVLHDSCLLCVT